MSSSQNFLLSSPLSASAGPRRKSKFTFKHLSQLASSSPTCPLRVICHIDLDAFYAQCEMVRLGVPEDQPLAVQQWQGLIAINYPARKFGLNRHITSTEAKKLCPELIMQHVATWKEGDEKWAYHEDAFKHMGTHKVSLDPYRMESRRILATIKEALPKDMQKVEKASIDEVFLDLSAQVHAILLERYPELNGPPPYDDPTENLPKPPTSALDWTTDALVDLDANETEDDDPDWDDHAICIGSEIMRNVRAAIREKLHYTCSGGIARNKMIAKLGSAHKKPDQQTVVRNRAISHFLGEFKFTKIRNLGGKLGDEIVDMFNTDSVKELLKVPLEQLTRLGDDTGLWVYSIIRGEDNSEVNPRTQIKSMLSAKSFRPSINTFEQAVRWIRIFAADIFSRCVEEGVLENKRRPKTINLHHRQGAQTRSRQAPIPQGKMLSEEILFDLAKNLLAQVVVDGRAWPCANLSLSVGGFEDGITGNKGIGGFLVRGDEAKAMMDSERVNSAAGHHSSTSDITPATKRRKLDGGGGGGIQRFFAHQRRGSSRGDSELDAEPDQPEPENSRSHSERPPSSPPPTDRIEQENRPINQDNITPSDLPPPSAQPQPQNPNAHNQTPTATTIPVPSLTIETHLCPRCSTPIPIPETTEHEDWHFAKDLAKQLQAEERDQQSAATTTTTTTTTMTGAAASSSRPQKPSTPKPGGRGRGRPPNSAAARGPEKGQKKLAFGKG